MSNRSSSQPPIPPTSGHIQPVSQPEEPTANAEIHFRVNPKYAVDIKMPGHQSGILLSMVIAAAIVAGPPLLFIATQVTLSTHEALLIATVQLALLFVIAIRRPKG